jgi:hypothetical protein
MSNKIKTRKAILLLAFIAVALCASARSVATAQFTITTPDSSWAVEDNSDNMRSVGSYVSLARYEDSRGKVLELAQVYSIDAVFDAGYFINRQAIQRHDLFCRAGKDFSTVTDTVFVGKKSKRVNFTRHRAATPTTARQSALMQATARFSLSAPIAAMSRPQSTA